MLSGLRRHLRGRPAASACAVLLGCAQLVPADRASLPSRALTAGNTEVPAADIRSRPEREQLAAAFRAAFGGRPPVRRHVEGLALEYRPGALRWIGPVAVLGSPGAVPGTHPGHNERGALAVHYLEADGGGLRVTGAWLEGGGEGGDHGAAPQWRFSAELGGAPMLRTEVSAHGQGHVCALAEYRELAGDGPRVVASIPIFYSNVDAILPGDAAAPVSVEGRIAAGVPGRSFDVAYVARDYVLRGGGFVPGPRRRWTERYVRRGLEFVLAEGESRVPTC